MTAQGWGRYFGPILFSQQSPKPIFSLLRHVVACFQQAPKTGAAACWLVKPRFCKSPCLAIVTPPPPHGVSLWQNVCAARMRLRAGRAHCKMFTAKCIHRARLLLGARRAHCTMFVDKCMCFARALWGGIHTARCSWQSGHNGACCCKEDPFPRLVAATFVEPFEFHPGGQHVWGS